MPFARLNSHIRIPMAQNESDPPDLVSSILTSELSTLGFRLLAFETLRFWHLTIRALGPHNLDMLGIWPWSWRLVVIRYPIMKFQLLAWLFQLMTLSYFPLAGRRLFPLQCWIGFYNAIRGPLNFYVCRSYSWLSFELIILHWSVSAILSLRRMCLVCWTLNLHRFVSVILSCVCLFPCDNFACSLKILIAIVLCCVIVSVYHSVRAHGY